MENLENYKKEVEALNEFVATEKITYMRCYGKINKSLFINLRGGFMVYHNNILVLECIQAFTAINKYISLT